MKRLLRLFSNLPVRTFQFRLLLYLLVVGSVPLLSALFVFYQQSTFYAHEELKNHVKRTHEQILRRIHAELVNMDHIATNINSDYLVQKYILTGGSDESYNEETFKARLDHLFAIQMKTSKYITDICVSYKEKGTSICPNSNILAADMMFFPVNKTDRQYQTYDNGGKMPYGIRFVAPLYDLTTEVVRGHIAIILNFSKLLGDIQNDNPIVRQAIFDKEGAVIYSSTKKFDYAGVFRDWEKPEIVVNSDNDTILSRNVLELPQQTWISVIEVKNQYLASAWRALRNTLILFFIVLLVVSAVCSIIFSRLFIKPIHHLRMLMKRAELGDLKAYWTARSTGEINDLGESYNQMLNRLEETIKQVKHEEALKKEAEIEALRYQLNPHFLYNTLNTIKWVAKIHKTPQISEVVSALVRLLQASLGKKGDFITIREEIGLIKDYMEIQSFRYGDQVKVHYDIEPVTLLCLVPRLILQPLVENALIHGIEPSSRDGVITIKTWIDRDLLMCQVEDNGQGMPDHSPDETGKKQGVKEKMSGIGLNHIREKIKLYYGPDYKMHIFSKEKQGTTVRLSLPIHRSEE